MTYQFFVKNVEKIYLPVLPVPVWLRKYARNKRILVVKAKPEGPAGLTTPRDTYFNSLEILGLYSTPHSIAFS